MSEEFIIDNEDFNIEEEMGADYGVTQFYVDQHDAATLTEAKEYVDSKNYVVSEEGKGLSSNDFTDADKEKLDNIGDLSELGALAFKDNASGTYTPQGNVVINSGSEGETNYTPAGSVSAPDITLTKTTATVNSITDIGTLPALSLTVVGENLTISWDAGTLPTKGSNQSVLADASAAASAPTFSGEGTSLSASFTGTEGTVSVS